MSWEIIAKIEPRHLDQNRANFQKHAGKTINLKVEGTSEQFKSVSSYAIAYAIAESSNAKQKLVQKRRKCKERYISQQFRNEDVHFTES
jgi:hypothetical protein